LFLDECFGKRDQPKRLQAAGYLVEPFRKHFPHDPSGNDVSIRDPKVIELCDERQWMLVTTDSNMQFTHVEALKKTNLLVLATAHNSADSMDGWVDALITLQTKVFRLHKKQIRPSFITFSQAGVITNIKPITAEMKTKRNRPREC